MCASKRFGKFAVLFLFLLTSLGSSIPVSAEAEEEPELLPTCFSAAFSLPKGILSNWKNLSTVWKNRFPI